MVLTESETYAKIGQRVKKYRTERGMSQDQLAEGICSRQTIGFLEHGRHLPSVDFLQKIADRLSIPLHEIMVDETKELEAKVQLDIVKVYIERMEYNEAVVLIEELEQREDLLEYQRRELTLCRAECLMRTGMADKAVEILTEMQRKLEMNRESDDHFMALLYDKLGNAFYFSANITTAHAHYMRAYQITQRFHEVDLVAARIAYNLGMACRLLNRNSDAVEYLTSAEQFFKKASDPSKLAHILFELGIAFRFSNDLERAEQYLKDALALYESNNIIHFARLVRESYAFTVLSLKNPNQAIDELILCTKEFEKTGDIPQIAYTCSRLAKLLMNQNRIDEAGGYLEGVLSKFTMDDASKDLRYVHIYQSYAEYLYETKKYDQCIKYSYMSSDLFSKMGYIRDAADSMSPAVKAYRKKGQFEKALELSEEMCDLLRRAQDQH